jgi:DNA mismatch repair protein MutS
MTLVQEYFELSSKYIKEYGQTTILLMQVGSFFEVYGKKKENTIYGSNILEFSQICELNVVDKNICVGTNVTEYDGIVMAGFKDIIIEKYLKKIQAAGYTAVVYTQDEKAKNTTRSLSGIFSPGTYFSNDETELTNNISCVWLEVIENKTSILKNINSKKMIVVGVANIDIYTGKSNIFQYSESIEHKTHSPITYDELERFISITCPTEIILIHNVQPTILDDITSYANIQSKKIHKINLNDSTMASSENKNFSLAKNCEKQIYQKEILKRFYPRVEDIDVFIQNFYENDFATQAFCFLLDFVYQHNPSLVNKIHEPIFENNSSRLVLANHSLKQLNMIDDNNFHGKYSSVCKMLNVCCTPMGKRKFSYDLLHPRKDVLYLQREYDMTEYFLSLEDTFTDVQKSLSGIKDFSKWNRQMIIKNITPKTFYQLYLNLEIILSIHKSYVEKDGNLMNYLCLSENAPLSDKINEYCCQIHDFLKKNLTIELCKDLDDMKDFEHNFIKKGIHHELDETTIQLTESFEKINSIKDYLNSLVACQEKKSKSSLKSTEYISLHETEKNNLSFILTKRRSLLLKQALPDNSTKLEYVSSFFEGEKKSFIFDGSKKDVEFITQSSSNNSVSCKQINELCKNITLTKLKIRELVGKIYLELVEKIETTFQNELNTIIQYVTVLDLLCAKTCIAKKYNYCKPQIVDEEPTSFVEAKGLRHCLIEYLQQDEIYVANDITLGKSNSENGILLYGTNAVGKTSLIRALGISVIMAQAGLYVPASEFNFKPYHYIFTRILGNDNIFKGLSTFAVEMSELRNILRLGDKNSLILGDELCSGTESTSAISIFVAGVQHLHKKESSFIFATHLHEIVKYDEITSISEKVALKHMEVIYDRENDCLVYDRKIRDGPGSSTYGLEVCKSLNLPDEFIQSANDIRIKYNPSTASILSMKTSHYNSKKIVGLCEKCGENIGTEVHHLQYQASANSAGIIEKKNKETLQTENIFHKNHNANLVTLCEKCHHNIHVESTTGHKKVKTTRGTKIKKIG